MYRHRTPAALLLSAATIGLGIGVGTVSAAPTSPQEPAADRGYGARAFLIGLRPPDGDAEAFGPFLKIGDVESHELAAPGSKGEAEDDYRTVITNPLRSAATISPYWKPDSVSTAPF
jgi:hypothetical protein